jgi:hypothetical protein
LNNKVYWLYNNVLVDRSKSLQQKRYSPGNKTITM